MRILAEYQMIMWIGQSSPEDLGVKTNDTELNNICTMQGPNQDRNLNVKFANVYSLDVTQE